MRNDWWKFKNPERKDHQDLDMEYPPITDEIRKYLQSHYANACHEVKVQQSKNEYGEIEGDHIQCPHCGDIVSDNGVGDLESDEIMTVDCDNCFKEYEVSYTVVKVLWQSRPKDEQ